MLSSRCGESVKWIDLLKISGCIVAYTLSHRVHGTGIHGILTYI